MLTISLILSLFGLVFALIYTVDWWQPLTITGTRLGIEDIIFAFSVAGISAAIYGVVFKKRILVKFAAGREKFARNVNVLFVCMLPLALMLGLFYVVGLNSFYSTVVAVTIPILIIWYERRDLIVNSIASGVLLALVSLLAFWIPELITPGWVNAFWNFDLFPKIIVLGAPLHDLIWFFLAGAFAGPLYEYWKSGREVDVKK